MVQRTVCGTEGVKDIKNYPYCRAYYKFLELLLLQLLN